MGHHDLQDLALAFLSSAAKKFCSPSIERLESKVWIKINVMQGFKMYFDILHPHREDQAIKYFRFNLN